MIALLVLFAAAAGAVTWSHLRPRVTSRARPFPSLQLLEGAARTPRPRFPLEDWIGWALRLATLIALAAGLSIDRSEGGGGQVEPVVVVDPSAGWDEAEEISSALVVGVQRGKARAVGPLAAFGEALLNDCSASWRTCLARAAEATGRPIVLVTPEPGSWAGVLGEVQSVVRVAARDGGTEKPIVRADAGAIIVDGGAAAMVLAAGLRAARVGPVVVAGDLRGVSDDPREVSEDPRGVSDDQRRVADAPGRVADDPVRRARRSQGAWAEPLVVSQAPRPLPSASVVVVPAVGEWNGAQVDAGSGEARFDALAQAVTGVPGIPLTHSLCIDGGVSIVGCLASRLPDGQIVVAATAEELGQWASTGDLVQLGRALLARLDAPVEITHVPDPQLAAWAWRGAGGEVAPLGLLDVGPGKYRSGDGGLIVRIDRAAEETPREGAPAERSTVRGGRFSLAGGLLALAVGLAGLTLLRRPRGLLRVLLGVIALCGLAALLQDLQRTVVRPMERIIVVDGPRLATAGGVTLASSAPCARPLRDGPCQVVGTLGAPDSGLETNLVLFWERDVRVDITSVRAPPAVPVGAAATVEIDVRVRNAAGRALELTVRPSLGLEERSSAPIDGDDRLMRVQVPVVPLTSGDGLLTVEATVAGGVPDARVLRLRVVEAGARRVLLAGSPSWESRFVASALREDAPGGAASLTRVGSTAAQAVDLPRQEPITWLRKPGALEDVDTLILSGFTPAELPGPILLAFLRQGGAVILLGGEQAEPLGFPGLGIPESAARACQVDLGDGSAPVDLETAVPLERPLPPGAHVLAWLSTREGVRRPWIVGLPVGEGRLVVVRSPELHRLSPPAGAGTNARRALLRAVGWVEAEADAESAPIPPSQIATATSVRRPWLRARAAERGVPYLEVDSAATLARLVAAVPRAPEVDWPLPLRVDDLFAGLLLAVLCAEALAARRGRREGRGATIAGDGSSAARTS